MLLRLLCLAFLCTLPSRVAGVFSEEDGVVLLDKKNFKKSIKNSDSVWLVEFFAPWCGHCKKFEPEVKKAAQALKGIAKVGVVDMDQNAVVGKKFGVTGFPTVKVFGFDKASPSTFEGERTSAALVTHAIKEVQNMALKRAGIELPPSSPAAATTTDPTDTQDTSTAQDTTSGTPKPKPKAEAEAEATGSLPPQPPPPVRKTEPIKKPKAKPKKPKKATDVVELTEANFEALVLMSEEAWLIEFYAPWCSHCKDLLPDFQRAATALKGKMGFGKIDATLHSKLADKYSVGQYPELFAFRPGDKDILPEKYEGGRSSAALIRSGRDLMQRVAKKADVLELSSQEIFQKNCASSSVCFLMAVPHILDTRAEGRNAYVAILQALAQHFKQYTQFSYVWMEAGAQPEIESALEIGGFGYPAVAAMNGKKGRFSVFQGIVNQDNIVNFVQNLLKGREKLYPMQGGVPEAVSTTPWDGKDGATPKDEL